MKSQHFYCLLAQFALLVPVACASFCTEDDAKYIREQEEDAPSPAPSMSVECTSQTSNARGRYTATASPCYFHFHKVNKDQRELDLIKFHTSDLCMEDNAFLTVREYVTDWADECVGDFQRCYSLEHHRPIVWDFLCAKEWQVPEGTTHMSVDCSQDKALILESNYHRREEMIRGKHVERVEKAEAKLFNVAGILGACLVTVFAISNLIVKPLVASRKDCTLPRNSQCACGTCSTSDEQGRVALLEAEAEIDDEGEEHESLHNRDMMVEFDSQIPDFGAVPITLHPTAPVRVESDLSTDNDTQSQLTDDFESSTRNPMELELVPMAEATTDIPIVEATVLQT